MAEDKVKFKWAIVKGDWTGKSDIGGEAETLDDAYAAINKWVKANDGRCDKGYCRMVCIEDGTMLIIDYGSWSRFGRIERTDHGRIEMPIAESTPAPEQAEQQENAKTEKDKRVEHPNCHRFHSLKEAKEAYASRGNKLWDDTGDPVDLVLLLSWLFDEQK